MKSKLVAYLLWLFSGFGILGFHRLYLGKIGTFFIWLFTAGCLGVGALIDLFTLGGQVDTINNAKQIRKINKEQKNQQKLNDALVEAK